MLRDRLVARPASTPGRAVLLHLSLHPGGLLQAVRAARRNPFRVLSYGGGLDSFAMLLLALQLGLHLDLVIFADVADPAHEDPGEWPGTYRHIQEVVRPLLASHGIPFVWLDTTVRPIRGARSLFRYFEEKKLMPSRMSRLCTSAAKVERIQSYVAEVAAGQPVEMLIGFEAGEEHRAAKDPHAKGRGTAALVNRFPLIEQRMCRCRAEAFVRRLGQPVPRKSACTFCPFGSRRDFQTLRREEPATFDRAQDLEDGSRLTKRGIKIRFSGGDGPRLSQWVEAPFRDRPIRCQVCGRLRASKATGCDWLDGDGVQVAGRLAS